MPSTDKGHSSITSSDQQLVLSSLEPEQISGVKKHAIPRRHLKGFAKFVVWSLRIYLVFMMIVVVYEVWTSLH